MRSRYRQAPTLTRAIAALEDERRRLERARRFFEINAECDRRLAQGATDQTLAAIAKAKR